MKQVILVIEDDSILNQLMTQHLSQLGFQVDGRGSWAEARRYLDRNDPALILTDARLPDADSSEYIESLAENYPVVVLTAFGSVRDAVTAIKAGASDYLLKPVSLDTLTLTIQRVLDTATLRKNHQFCKKQLQKRNQNNSSLVGASDALEHVRDLIKAVAPNDITVLIQGESGTGKELVARAVHVQSNRTENNFVAVDCCTLQENLFESELFGHEKGAFTGANKKKNGLIEGAEGGTLFLDEIGEINSGSQAKLLRILETGQYRRLGGTKDLNANVRIVAATNRDLEAMSKEGSFRADLFFRLNAFSIKVPPLRERREDIPHLARYFVKNHTFSTRVNKTFSASAIHELVSYDWPGNIRELKNMVERAIILSGDRPNIRPGHFNLRSSANGQNALVSLSFDHEPSLEELGAHYLAMQLKKHSGRRAKVADILGVSERSVYRMIKRYGLDD
ncbi:MAG: sigma-54 dependent transcriptional regulator [Gammaproteobacteria bacterium]|nr:sigma-54 dependent transcriptional regulator [Gammaproteobacteria bacterium]